MVRAATSPEDFAHLHRLIVAYEDELPPDLRHGDVASTRFDSAFIAIDDEAARGCVLMTALDATTVVVTKLYVRPEDRGQGLSRTLMSALLEAARAGRYTRVVLDTDKVQLRAAYQLYRALGFVECAPYGPVDYATPTFMEKKL